MQSSKEGYFLQEKVLVSFSTFDRKKEDISIDDGTCYDAVFLVRVWIACRESDKDFDDLRN